jgi:hypothetical protein
MDELVKAALVKWPNVPHCYGWLGLDARGNWYMRDDRAQSAGPFALPAGADDVAEVDPARRLAAKGSLLKHDKLIEFIQRNYESDAQGQWFFQNGPQRVYVELEAAPFVWRLGSDFSVTAHSGLGARPQRCVLDELGRLYLETDIGFGLVHTQDMETAADAVEQGLWVPVEIAAAALPLRFGFVASPQALQAAPPQQP